MLTYNGPYMLPPTVLMEPKGKYADYYQSHIPTMPQAPVHPYLEAWAKGRGPSGEMIKEGTTAWAAIRALNNNIAMVNTAAETTLVDDGVGRLLQAVENDGFEQNTVVIFTSDQGSSYGQHGLWGNTSWSFPFTAYQVNTQVPLIVRYPGHVEGGTNSERFINQVDLFPTILEYTDITQKRIDRSFGKSFVPILEGREIAWKDVAFFEFVTIRLIQTPEWQFAKHFASDVPRELYHLQQDPDQLNNLASDPAYAAIVKQLDERLTAHFNSYSDPKYDLWHGGTAKAILLDKHYGANHIFADAFPEWVKPGVEKAVPYAEHEAQ
jgi:arylsulfatase A-like enzyme